MSLLIASSAQGEFNFGQDDDNIGSAIQRPYSFINHLSNTITIPANSEVAVTSVQMYKGQVYNITPAMKFYTYHGWNAGQEVGADPSGIKLDDTNNEIVPVHIIPGKYSQRQMQNELKRCLSASFGVHPDLNNRAEGGLACLVNAANTTDQPQANPLSGFNFVVKQRGRHLNINIYPEGVAPTYPLVAPVSALIQNCGIMFDVVGCEVVNAVAPKTPTLIRRNALVANNTNPLVFDERAVCQLMDAPMSLNGTKAYVSPKAGTVYDGVGALCVNTKFAESGWMVGLSRPTITTGDWVAGVRHQLNSFRAPMWFQDDHDNTYNNPQPVPPLVPDNGWPGGFYDYVVMWRPHDIPSQQGGFISLWHSVHDPTMGINGGTRMQEIEYWGVGGTTSSHATQLTDVDIGAGRTYVNFSCWNEQIQIWINDNSGGVGSGRCIMDTLLDPNLTGTLQPAGIDNLPWQRLGLTRAAKPGNQNTQALYPKFQIIEPNEYLEIIQQEANCAIDNTHGRGPYSYNYPLIPNHEAIAWAAPSGLDSETGIGSTWWGRVLKNRDPFYRGQARACDSRPSMDVLRNAAGGDVMTPYRGMDLSAFGSIMNEGKMYGYGLIIQATQDGLDANQTEEGVFPNDAYGMRGPLGFGAGAGAGFDMSGLDTNVSGQIFSPWTNAVASPNGVGRLQDSTGTTPTQNGTNGPTHSWYEWRFQSSSPPSHMGGTSFVKCSSLTHQSYNFSKSLPSKILWQIPKFGGEATAGQGHGQGLGSDAGALYFENSSPIYLDLNNPAPLVLNELHIEIVDKNEKFVEDLTGPTTLTLHIRPKR